MFFSTVWGWIKRWFDPITVSKIFILGHHEVKPVLSSFIDTKNIPKQYGGELDYNWGEMPNLDPAIREAVTFENGYTEFPKGPLFWKTIDDGERVECIAVGSVDRVERKQRICTMKRSYKGVNAALPEEMEAAAIEAEAQANHKSAETTGTEAKTEAQPNGAVVADMQNLTINDSTEIKAEGEVSEKGKQKDTAEESELSGKGELSDDGQEKDAADDGSTASPEETHTPDEGN